MADTRATLWALIYIYHILGETKLAECMLTGCCNRVCYEVLADSTEEGDSIDIFFWLVYLLLFFLVLLFLLFLGLVRYRLNIRLIDLLRLLIMLVGLAIIILDEHGFWNDLFIGLSHSK